MRRWMTVLLVAALGALARPVLAVPTLYLDDGSTSVTITDGSALDLNPAVGVVTFLGPLGIGPWAINVTTGITNPVLGSDAFPHLDLSSVNITTTGPGSLTIRWSDDGFGPTPGVLAAVGGTIGFGGSLVYSTYGDATNTLCVAGLCPGLLTSSLFAGLAFSGTAGASVFGLGSPYSLTQEVVITHTGVGATSFDASLEGVPEPGTLLLLGSGLTGLALRRRQRNS